MKASALGNASPWPDTTQVTPLQPRIPKRQLSHPGSPLPCFVSHLRTQAVASDRLRLASQLCGLLQTT